MTCTCTECDRPVHPERLAAIPHAKTCSSACTELRQKRLQAATSLRTHRKRRERERRGKPSQ